MSERPRSEENEDYSQWTAVVVEPKATCTTVVKIATLEIETARIENLNADFSFPWSELFNTKSGQPSYKSYGKQDTTYSDEVLTPSETSMRTPLSTGHAYPQRLEPLSENSSKPSIEYLAVLLIVIVVGIFARFMLCQNLRANATSHTTQHTASRHALQPKTKQEHKDVINFTPVSGSKISDGVKRQACRALPNERLKIVFGIENAFTTIDIRIHGAFRAAAVKKMQEAIQLDKSELQAHDGNWTQLRDLARASVAQMLSPDTEEVRLVDLVRVVTLTLSFRFLFSIPEERLLAKTTLEQLILIGQKINDLWIGSKDTTQPLTPWDSSTNEDIHEALRNICRFSISQEETWDPLIPAQNPLNFLLPAYETMWRAVLSGVLEVYFRKDTPAASTWHFILQSYINKPSRKEFKHTSLGGGLSRSPNSRELSTSDIVKEILRLYPPTKHVYRRFPSAASSTPPSSSSSLEASPDTIASIESLHRDTSADGFGPDALVFRPERWLEMRNDFRAETDASEIQPSDKPVQKNELRIQTDDDQVHPTEGQVQTNTSASDTRAQPKSKTCPEPTCIESAMKKMEEDRGFIPFATFCPAGKGETQGFGMKMIGLLVGVLGDALVGGDRERAGQDGEARDGQVSWDLIDEYDKKCLLASPLSGDRKAFEAIIMFRRRKEGRNEFSSLTWDTLSNKRELHKHS